MQRTEERSNSVLFLSLNEADGNVTLQNSIPVQELTLKKVSIVWDAQSDSATAGNYINLQLGDVFSNLRVVSNRDGISNYFPLINDADSRTTILSLDIPIHIDKPIRNSFHFKITKADGTLVANIESIEIMFSFSDGVII